MRIVDHDELPPGAEGQVQLLDLSAGWGPMDFQRMRKARRVGYPATDYFGVYAVEDGEVLAMVRALRVPFTTTKGVEWAGAVQGVVTRRDRGRRGLARRLLEEVHRREREVGCRFVLLWTGRGMVAHGLYESTGYRDVYTPELATVNCVRTSRKPEGYELKKLRRVDTGLAEKLHAEATRDRTGFTPRPAGIVASLLTLGFLRLESFRLILRDSKPVGYAIFQKNPGWSKLDELVLLDRTEIGDVLALFESEVPGSWLSIRNTAVRDSLDVLRRRHYQVTYLSYYSLLALATEGRNSDVSRMLGTASRTFTCQMLDYF